MTLHKAFDGEVYYWWDDDRQQPSKVPPKKKRPIVTNDRDTPQMDWQQVLLNGGPPCFFVEGPQYCGRAERWQGHGNKAFHDYVSLDDLLGTARKEAQESERKSVLEVVQRVPATAAGASAFRKKLIEELYRAAANRAEGDGDG